MDQINVRLIVAIVREINTGVGKCEVYFDVGKYDIIRYLEKSVKNYDVATCVIFI